MYLNAKPGAINLLGEHRCDFGLGNHPLATTTSKTWSIKEHTDVRLHQNYGILHFKRHC